MEQQPRRKIPPNCFICPHSLEPLTHHLHGEDSVGWGRQMGVPRRTYSFPGATVHPGNVGEWYPLPRTEKTGTKRGTRELRNGWKVVGRGSRKGDPPATLPYVRKLKDRPALDAERRRRRQMREPVARKKELQSPQPYPPDICTQHPARKATYHAPPRASLQLAGLRNTNPARAGSTFCHLYYGQE